MQPTKEQFNNYQGLYDFLNAELFGGDLPGCMLVMHPKANRFGGHFSAERWEKDGKPVHEISMNPHGYSVHEPRFFVSILLHEMVHLWVQENVAKPPRGGYHCKRWGNKMKEVGLYPSNTGEEGGKETGQQMSHYVVEHGLFAEVWERMDKALLLPFKRYENAKKPRKKSKVKYTCPLCGANSWAKPGSLIGCMEHEAPEKMLSED